jgi:Zn-dependent peptidase ImmA (M78 family)/DNA-binding XRE family transcriptional regulator
LSIIVDIYILLLKGCDIMETAQIAKNARRLRHDRELTQKQVAKKSGISVPTYSKIESGKASPRVDTLYKVASALDVSIQELLAPVRELRAVRFRAQKKLKRRDQVLAKAANWLDDFNYLLKEVESDSKYTLSNIPSELQGTAAAKRPLIAAKLAREEMGLDAEEPIHDITGLFASNGIKVLTYTLKSDAFFGMSIGESEGGPAIVINVWDRIAVERWIFSAAHELGHLLLHIHAYDVDVIEEDEQQEKEANAFASEFLMPQKKFEKEWKETRGLSTWQRILKVKRIFHISDKTIIWRLLELGVFTRDIWRERNKFLKQVYKARNPSKYEPEPLRSYDFVTDWLDRLVRNAVESEIITLSRASEILDIPLQEVRQRSALWAEEQVVKRS